MEALRRRIVELEEERRYSQEEKVRKMLKKVYKQEGKEGIQMLMKRVKMRMEQDEALRKERDGGFGVVTILSEEEREYEVARCETGPKEDEELTRCALETREDERESTTSIV